MCANYETAKYDKKMERLARAGAVSFEHGQEIYPGGVAPFLAAQHPGLWLPGCFGIMPPWAKPHHYRMTYNARSETVGTKSSFRKAWKFRQLAIIPATAIYEPYYGEDGKCKPVRWRIERADETPFGIAGIYERRLSDSGPAKWSFSMLTINAEGHPLMQQFHAPEDEKRSVVILDDDEWMDWLSAKTDSDLQGFLRLFDPADFKASPSPRKAGWKKPDLFDHSGT